MNDYKIEHIPTQPNPFSSDFKKPVFHKVFIPPPPPPSDNNSHLFLPFLLVFLIFYSLKHFILL